MQKPVCFKIDGLWLGAFLWHAHADGDAQARELDRQIQRAKAGWWVGGRGGGVQWGGSVEKRQQEDKGHSWTVPLPLGGLFDCEGRTDAACTPGPVTRRSDRMRV